MDLEQTIADAVNDSQIAEDTSADVSVEAVDTTPEPVEAVASDTPADDGTEDVPSPEIASPAASNEPQDEFERLAGMTQMGVAGRENRIPYSRVKKITEKAVSDLAEVAVGRKLTAGEKAIDVVRAHVAQLPELQTKITDYEARLSTVGQFEQVMANEPQRFLQMLAKLPAYSDFFALVEKAYYQQPGVAQPDPNAATVQPQLPATGEEAMPEPNEELEDGTKVYNMDGLKSLLAWQARQTEARVSKQIEERYKPIESEWQERRRIEATLPVIRKQIEEAKTWEFFNESEEEITKALEADSTLSLEAAYRKIVFPKIIADRNKMRQGFIQEVKNAPTSTAVKARPATKPTVAATGARSLEDIIKEQVDTIKR